MNIIRSCLLFLALGSASAQAAQPMSPPQQVSVLSSPDVVRAIGQAGHELVAYLPYAEQLDIADALRVAALRGKRIFLITSKAGIIDPQGFTLRLAHVPGVRTYLAAENGQPFLIVDGTLAYSGSGLIQDGIGTRVMVVRPEALLQWAQAVTRGTPANKVDLLKLRYRPVQPHP